MINLDLSKAPSLRILIYLLALIPGLFFLLCLAVGDPRLAKTTIEQIDGVYPVSPFGLLLILAGSGLVIGQAFILLSWLVESVLAAIYRALRAAFRKLFGGQRLYRWVASHQRIPPAKTGIAIRALQELHLRARGGRGDSEYAGALRLCLAAAAEKLLERRYGIGLDQPLGPEEWEVWFSFLGRPIERLIESMNAGRIILACGVAGFSSLGFAPRLIQRYFISMCSVFVFCGLWQAGWYLLQIRNPIKRDSLRLKSILLELQGLSPPGPKTGTTDTQ
jgi:hypothetical protein